MLPVTPHTINVNVAVVPDWFTPEIYTLSTDVIVLRITPDVSIFFNASQLQTINRLINTYTWENLEVEDVEEDVWDESNIDYYAEASLFGEE